MRHRRINLVELLFAFETPALVVSLCCIVLSGCGQRNAPVPAKGPAKGPGRPGLSSAIPDPGFVRCAELKDPEKPDVKLQLQGKPYQRKGFVLTALWREKSPAVRLGLVADAHGSSPDITANLRFFGHAFSRSAVRAVLVLGGMGRGSEELATNLSTLLDSSRAPILFLPGHTEDARVYPDVLSRLRKAGREVVDLSSVRIIVWPETAIASVPGHHRHQLLLAGWWGCGFIPYDVAAFAPHLEALGKKPILLATHTPLLMSGTAGLDLTRSQVHVGSHALMTLVKKTRIRFGVSAHVHEAAPAGTDLDGRASVLPGSFSSVLFASPGSADSVPHPSRTKAASRGSAAIIELRFAASPGAAGPGDRPAKAMYRVILPPKARTTR